MSPTTIKPPRKRVKEFFVKRKCRQNKGVDGWTDATGVSFKTQYEAEKEAIKLTALMYASHRVYRLGQALVQFAPSGSEVVKQELDPRNELEPYLRSKGETNEARDISRIDGSQRQRAACR